MQEFRHF